MDSTSTIKRHRLGIVVPFYEGTIYFDQLLGSIQRAIEALDGSMYSVRTMVIDNSVEDHGGFFEKYQEDIIYVKEKPRIGFGSACNVGFRHFRKEGYDYTLFVNQDGAFDVMCLKNLLKAFVLDGGIAFASALQLTYETRQVETFLIQYYLHDIPELITDLVLGHPRKPFYPIENIPGSCFVINMSRYNPNYRNLFDENFFMYFEDGDLCKRFRDEGKRMVLVPNAFFLHKHSQTTDASKKEEISYHNQVSERYFLIQHAGNRFVKMTGIVVDDSLNALKDLLRGRLGTFSKRIGILSRSLALGMRKRKL